VNRSVPSVALPKGWLLFGSDFGGSGALADARTARAVGALLVPVADVVPGKSGCDADHSEDDSTGDHSGGYNPDWFGGVPPSRNDPPCLCVLRKQSTHLQGACIPPPRRRRGGGKKRREPLTPVIKEDTLSLVGRVIETFPSSTFKVELENGHTILASLAGRLRRFRIRITPGDDVDVELSPYDLTRGRITYRRQGRNA
jgi:translation initiation factor IF-1